MNDSGEHGFADMENEVEIIAKLSSKQHQTPSRGRSGSREGSVGKRPRSSRPHETEEEAIIRRFHDAQRMARFRARRKKALEDQQLQHNGRDDSESEGRPEGGSPETESKYAQLLAIIEGIGRDVRLSYAGSRSSAERLKCGIVRARSLVRDCLIETSLNLRQ
ncbi:uncharacterized protein LOC106646085 [Copidosoma floridanum]|uniref:uncharacterized protein LOC106646085 n=1 Tax=Copidosoma floridanum TaxID=29053 RepID=UPI0006C9ABCC|nr:uncharacterized protein LOC106646085 [Copidosoma floridanum]